VRILCRTRAKELLTNKKGEVLGVLADTKDGEIKVIAKSVIIATGGFAGDTGLLRSYLPSYNKKDFNLRGIPHQGDGLKMAVEIGAATEGMVVLEMNGPGVPESAHLTVVANHPNTMWVNKKGKRFTDESIALFPESANSLYRQPGKISYSLFDDRIRRSIFEDELKPLDALIVGNRTWPSKADEDLHSETGKGRVKRCDSWHELAKWIGAVPEVLKAEINEYNEFCDQGHDSLFVKDPRHLIPIRKPPFYAIQCGLNLMTTHGGIKVNHHMEVLDTRDKPIPGLFAAGVETGGTDSDTYDAHLTGHSFGFTINSGRIAAENAVKYIIGE
jgi:fumarate reductase flavoprotein subunit